MASSDAHKNAAKKWAKGNTENLTVKLMVGKDPAKDRIKAAAEREGLSLNRFVVECIKDKL